MEKFQHKKSLGQNFLKSEKALKQIVEAGGISNGEWVLEIGPGLGVLTEKILEKGANLVSVEKDRNLIENLNKKFEKEIKNGNLFLIEQDALVFETENSPLQNKNYKIIANIPYYITGEILRKALSIWRQPTKMVLMVQKEVAKRICSKEKESLLSISVKIYGEPKIIDIVKAGSFYPAPKVDSAIIEISSISKDKLNGIDEAKFFEIVKTGFAHKRKMLGGNLKEIYKENTDNILEKTNISYKSRAEDLKLEDWLKLTKITN